MPMLKPVDHQNIMLRLIGIGSVTETYLVGRVHGYCLPLQLHDVRLACDALVSAGLARRTATGEVALTSAGSQERARVPMIAHYVTCGGADTEAAERNDAMLIAIRGESS